MNIFAFDPGSNYTGVATIYDDGDVWWGQHSDPLECWEQLLEHGQKDDIVLIEGYRSGGHLTKEAKATIEVVGGLKMMARYGWGWGPGSYVLRVEQHRLSGRREAAEMMGGTIEELESDVNRKDAFSALAHCIVYRRTLS